MPLGPLFRPADAAAKPDPTRPHGPFEVVKVDMRDVWEVGFREGGSAQVCCGWANNSGCGYSEGGFPGGEMNHVHDTPLRWTPT